MRRIEERMREAVRARKNWRQGNTQVATEKFTTAVYLHGNLIFIKVGNVTYFTLAGWNTPTTRSRLRALGIDVRQHNWQATYNGKPISTTGMYVAE